MLIFIFIVIAVLVFYNIFKRIDNLEKKVVSLSKDGVVPTHSASTSTVTPPASRLTPTGTMAETRTSTPLTPPVTSRSTIPPVFSSPKTSPTQSQHEGGTEFAVGSKLLTGIGVFALILGVGFFFRYAFENNLISEGARIMIGIVLGIIVIAIGHMLRAKYAQYGHTLVGAGIGILYLSTYSAYSLYGLISTIPAFILLVIITALGVGLALAYNSKPLVSYAFLGAFIIPLLLPLAQSIHILFLYLIVLNLGVLLIARFKIWPEFTLASMIGSSVIFLQWVSGPYTEALYIPTLLYGTLLFIMYFITSLLNFVYRDRNYKGIDGLLLYGTPTAYFLLMLSIVHGKEDIALLSAMIGIFYIVFSLLIRAGFGALGELRTFSNAMLCIASPFIAAATALHFEGSTITIIWAIEAVVMISIGYILQTSSNRIAGLVLTVFTCIRMFAFDLNLPQGASIFFNERSATLLFVTLACLVIWRIYNAYIPKITGVHHDEIVAGQAVGAFGLYIVLFTWLTLEVNDFVSDFGLYIPVVWMIFTSVMMSVGVLARDKVFRVLSYVLLIVSIFAEFIMHYNLASSEPIFFNIRVATMIVAVLTIAYIVWLSTTHKDVFNDEERRLNVTLTLIANFMVIWALSLEIVSYFRLQIENGQAFATVENTKRVSLSAFWLIYALGGLAVGIFRKSISVRYASIILFAISIFKIFLYDTANLSDVYRFISFITLGVILLVAGFAYYRFKSRILELVSGEHVDNKV